ncbi:MAG TPA: DinB family protein [Acidimicrobiales bacterium]|nr:MAG: hypothetical protein B7Z69_00725 [Actinobacteria bacterium 21-73-9]HQU26266.1 DinB family protein [Acidimicrobiales bacterium]
MSPYDERCPVCGFRWSAVTLAEVPDRVRGATEEIIATLSAMGPRVTERMAPERWSALEYGGHVRDVLVSLRERVLLACASPEIAISPSMFRDERVDLGFYARDTLEAVATELRALAALFGRTVTCVPTGLEGRTLLFPGRDEPVSVAWLGAQAVHECEHHLGDVREDLARTMG